MTETSILLHIKMLGMNEEKFKGVFIISGFIMIQYDYIMNNDKILKLQTGSMPHCVGYIKIMRSTLFFKLNDRVTPRAPTK